MINLCRDTHGFYIQASILSIQYMQSDAHKAHKAGFVDSIWNEQTLGARNGSRTE